MKVEPAVGTLAPPVLAARPTARCAPRVHAPQGRTAAGDAAALVGSEFLATAARQVAEALAVAYVFVAETVGEGGEQARTLAVCVHGELVANFAYPLQRMPCREVVERGAVSYSLDVPEPFALAAILGEPNLKSYLGLRLLGGARAAWIALADTRPLRPSREVEAALQLVHARAAAEVRRLRREAGAQDEARRLRSITETRTAELTAVRQALEEANERASRAEAALRFSEDKFARAFRANPALMSITTAKLGRLVEVNDTFLRTTGYERSEVIGKTGSELGLWSEPEERERLVRVLQIEGTLRNREVVFRTRSGELRVALASAETLAIGSEPCVLSVAVDITERKRAEAALRASEERYALAERGANDGLWDWQLSAREIYFSPRFKEMLGHREDEISNHPREWLMRTHPEDRDRLGMEIVAHLEGVTTHFQSEFRIRHRSGSHLWVLCRGLAVRDAFGGATRFAGSMTDISARKTAEQRLMHDAFHDGLTGLANRALFMDRLGHAFERARRHGSEHFAVLFLDVDRFKVVNDGLGHAAGDRLLEGLARRLRGGLRPEDTMARLGGDEFAVLLEGIRDIGDATRVANRIDDEMREPFDLGDQEVFASVSIGIALHTGGYQGPEEVLRDADTAMYRAKALGRSRYEVFDQEMHVRALETLQLETDLRRAVQQSGELWLGYQPIVSLKDGRIAGLEALMRWKHPVRGPVSPADFIRIAEETGLIVPLGAWALMEACRHARSWLDRFGIWGATPVSVNLSARQFQHADIADEVAKILDDSGLPGRLLKLEITESVIMENDTSAAEMLGRLRDLEVRVSIDDFGTGYSCLSRLHSLPIDTLKIDRSFVNRIDANGEGGETVGAIVALAAGLGMDVVAEGVETEFQRARLEALGCGYAQGFLFAEALPGDRIADLIAAQKTW